MIPRLRPRLGLPELLAALRPGDDAQAVTEFEQAFADMTGQRHAVAFPYGRTGLYCLLKALGLRNSMVVTPAWTCVVVPHATVSSGNEPVFVDSAPGDYNMDLRRAGETLDETDAGALIATSIFGHPVDLDALEALRRTHPGVCIIQDCAHSFLCEHGGRPVHAYGDAAVFGLNVSKLMSSIFGGMVATDDDTLAARLRNERSKTLSPAPWRKAWSRRIYLAASMLALWPPAYSAVNLLERSGALGRFVSYYDEGRIDMPADWDVAMTAPEARVGVVQCGRYTSIIANRRRNAAAYTEALRHIPGITLPPHDDGATWSHYTILVDRREALLDRALRAGIQLGRLIEYNIPDMPAYRARPGYRDCPRARRLAEHSVNLPVWCGPRDVQRVIDFLKNTMGHY
ncbi:MAG: DegT/DnrJ/EryC1/StrS aminotransferase family protein [Desulfovibrio sp.]|nr:DegT/DnrJ/EryC1/StrS aminotransferase family protein [Desulfovibrio sp.]